MIKQCQDSWGHGHCETHDQDISACLREKYSRLYDVAKKVSQGDLSAPAMQELREAVLVL